MSVRERAAQAATFTLARGRDEGYRVLTAPEFLVTGHRTHVLSDLASAGHPDGEVVHDSAELTGGRSVFVSYTSRPVTADDLDEQGLRRLGSPPRDAFGRPLRIVYGVAYQGRTPRDVPLSRLDQAERAATEAFRAFIADESGFRLRVSPPVDVPVRGGKADGTTDGKQARGPVSDPGRRGPLLVLAGAALAVVCALVLVLTSLGTSDEHRRNPRVSASGSSSAPASTRRFPPAERMLYDRLSGHVKACVPARGADRIGGADATLGCSVTDRRPDSPLFAASFTTAKALNVFLATEERRERADRQKGTQDGKPFARAEEWKGVSGSTGRVITYRAADGKAWVVWSFTTGSFTDAHQKYFIVRASGRNADALYAWWRTHPV